MINPATCEHYSVVNNGEIACKRCGWVYRIGLDGSRWVNPHEHPSDAIRGGAVPWK